MDVLTVEVLKAQMLFVPSVQARLKHGNKLGSPVGAIHGVSVTDFGRGHELTTPRKYATISNTFHVLHSIANA